jgi:hypothetical protein
MEDPAGHRRLAMRVVPQVARRLRSGAPSLGRFSTRPGTDRRGSPLSLGAKRRRVRRAACSPAIGFRTVRARIGGLFLSPSGRGLAARVAEAVCLLGWGTFRGRAC